MKPSYKLFIQAILFAIFYGIAFYVIQFFLAKTTLLGIQPSSHNLISWDVGFYDSIRKGGYDASTDNTGFFILFPLLWKLSHLGVWGIVIFNILSFAIGFGFLMITLKEENEVFWLLCLTLPSIYFEFIPYTESLFFLFGSLIIYFLKKKKLFLIWISLLLISLVRATTLFLLPALLAMEILSSHHKYWWKSSLKFLYKYALPSIIGLALFVCLQYFQTGIWFAYFKKQSEHWGHSFSLPSFPFSNIENGNLRYHWLSALALFIAFLAIIWLCKQLYLWLKEKNEKDLGLIFSMGYLAMLLIFILFFNPKYGGFHTNVMGANRYTFATPFCFYFIHYFYKKRYSTKNIITLLILSNIFWSLFGAFHNTFSYFIIGLIPTSLILFFMLNNYTKRQNNWFLILIIVFNFLIQILLFQQFISPLYMD